MNTSSADILIERDPPIAWVRVNRPEVRNALSFDLAGRLIETIRSLDAERDILVVILAGSGERAFISGADITEFRTQLTTPEKAIAFDERFEAMNRTLETMSKPVIASIRGAAVGSGLFLALSCDMRVAAEETKFGVPVAKIGLIPSLSDIRRFVRFAGVAATKRLLFTGQIIDAAEALSLRLVDKVVPPEQLEKTVRDLARTVANRAPLSISAVKRLLSELSNDNAEADDLGDIYHQIYTSRDFAEGVAAFLERRPPVFEGK